jgi:hypothetical protein
MVMRRLPSLHAQLLIGLALGDGAIGLALLAPIHLLPGGGF